MKRVCDWCGIGIVTTRADARFCSSKHRIYAHRAAKRSPIPQRLTSRDRWVRWRYELRNGKPTKAPITADGRRATSTNPDTWTTFAAASASTLGEGLGFTLGDGIGCIDVDHCVSDGVIDPRALELARTPNAFYVEYSPSGEGIHIWHDADEQPGTRRTENGLSVERYSAGRYITVTGRPIGL
ncbi:hypothetical protein P2P98_03110 [Microbacterium sp. Kw_RZR3]|uniref:hypothetical protein n=1 Tax=Microbacterium sp. Kw_RZR3 TaxID=3032903 RepID=UPI0023D981D1|nr:hypothetical protein [Microbacterium sp. Kw_RZR3]MDF2045138.1 hypothetical protein [Microbacterium sp. Kw_RZR3]